MIFYSIDSFFLIRIHKPIGEDINKGKSEEKLTYFSEIYDDIFYIVLI